VCLLACQLLCGLADRDFVAEVWSEISLHWREERNLGSQTALQPTNEKAELINLRLLFFLFIPFCLSQLPFVVYNGYCRRNMKPVFHCDTICRMYFITNTEAAVITSSNGIPCLVLYSTVQSNKTLLNHLFNINIIL
jgi:hypothetical protein